MVTDLHFSSPEPEVGTLVQIIEPAANIAVLVAIGIAFIVSLESRWKRKQALLSLHSLRSIIHVIDMHQLTKDPSVLLDAIEPTASSPKRVMGRLEIHRYLDYCSEMLSLSGKIAALYTQSIQDAVVIDTVNELEELSTNLSRKIWQKIVMLDRAGLAPAGGSLSRSSGRVAGRRRGTPVRRCGIDNSTVQSQTAVHSDVRQLFEESRSVGLTELAADPRQRSYLLGRVP